MVIEVLDLAEVGSGWAIGDYSKAEKDELEKENALFRFKGKKEFIDFAEYVSSVHMEECREFKKVMEAIKYLQDLNYSIAINR